MANRSRCASPGSIRSPGVPRSCCQGIGRTPHSDRAGNTVQRRSSPSSAADAKPGFRSHDGVVTLGPCHAPFVAFANLGSPADGHHPERCRHHRNGPRPGPADPRWCGWTRLRRWGAAGCGLRGRGSRADPSGRRGSCRWRRGWSGLRRWGAAGCGLRGRGSRADPSGRRGSCRWRRGWSGLRCRGAAGHRLRASWPGPLRPTGWSSSGGSGPDPGLDAVAPGPHPPAGLRPAAKALSAPAPSPQLTPAATRPPRRRRGR